MLQKQFKSFAAVYTYVKKNVKKGIDIPAVVSTTVIRLKAFRPEMEEYEKKLETAKKTFVYALEYNKNKDGSDMDYRVIGSLTLAVSGGTSVSFVSEGRWANPTIPSKV